MSDERLWKFRKPQWLSSIWARNSGVYGAGALVRLIILPFSDQTHVIPDPPSPPTC
jgi:hypothetical protein